MMELGTDIIKSLKELFKALYVIIVLWLREFGK